MALHEHPIILGERGMRVIRFPLFRLIVAISILLISSALAYFLTDLAIKVFGSEPFPLFRLSLVTILISLLSIWFYKIYVALFEGRQTSELNLKSFLPQMGLGLLFGFAFISIIILIISLFGGYHISGTNKALVMLPVFIAAIQAGIFEEILSRGAIFRIVEDGLGTWWSVLISAMIFGFLHIWNPNATVFSSLSIAITAGVVLALLYVITRKLWIPIGVHIAWNFALGGIYGAPVSGGAKNGFLISEMKGSDVLTGGEFGPEASIVTVIVGILIGIFLSIYCIRKKAIKRPRWKRPKGEYLNIQP